MGVRGRRSIRSRRSPRGTADGFTPAAEPDEPGVLELREADGDVTVRVRVQPRAAHEGLAGVRAGALVVRLNAPPVEGAANAALSRLLGRALGVPASRVSLLRGERGRDKLVRVADVAAADVRRRLEGQP